MRASAEPVAVRDEYGAGGSGNPCTRIETQTDPTHASSAADGRTPVMRSGSGASRRNGRFRARGGRQTELEQAESGVAFGTRGGAVRAGFSAHTNTAQTSAEPSGGPEFGACPGKISVAVAKHVDTEHVPEAISAFRSGFARHPALRHPPSALDGGRAFAAAGCPTASASTNINGRITVIERESRYMRSTLARPEPARHPRFGECGQLPYLWKPPVSPGNSLATRRFRSGTNLVVD